VIKALPKPRLRGNNRYPLSDAKLEFMKASAISVQDAQTGFTEWKETSLVHGRLFKQEGRVIWM
jgi:hypothetical protein